MKLVYALVILIVGGVAAFLFHAIQQAREAARESSCRGRMCQLEVALRSYEWKEGHLPPAYVLGPDGKPWHSWRVLLLPYMEGHDIYSRYHFDEPWNGPNNLKLAKEFDAFLFRCPSGSDPNRTSDTNYVVVVGEGTAFPGEKTTKFADFKDGVENTVLLVEVENTGIHWMEPRDLQFDSLTIGKSSHDARSVSSPHSGGPGVVFADKITAYRLQQPLSNETLRALLTIAGGEAVTRDSLLEPDGTPRLSDYSDEGAK